MLTVYRAYRACLLGSTDRACHRVCLMGYAFGAYLIGPALYGLPFGAAFLGLPFRAYLLGPDL